MKTTNVKVDQIHYDEFEEYSNTKMAIVTQWWNGEGVDVFISRKHMEDINISLNWDDIMLMRKIFADVEF